jgi:hypothetical protein
MAVILRIVANGRGVRERLRHAVMQPVDDWRLLGWDVYKVWR